MSDSKGFNVWSECVDENSADYGKSPTFEGWFERREDADMEATYLQSEGRAAWVSEDRDEGPRS